MSKRSISLIIFCVLAVLASSVSAHAMPGAINEAVLKDYTPAVWHRGLETAYEEPISSMLRGFVVVERGGIPAERARHFITWSDYDYRGVVVHLDDKDKITTRRGAPYAYLSRGDVMAVAGVKYFNRTVYLKLISAEVYVPQNRIHDKRHSRVTVMLGFKFPKDVVKDDDASAVIAAMQSWVKPFPNLADAQSYAGGLRDEASYVASQSAPAPVGAAAEAAGAASADDEKIKSLEEKIERARQDLDEAEKELKDLKSPQ